MGLDSGLGLPLDQMHFLSVVLSFFAISDKIFANNLIQTFMTKQSNIPQSKIFFYGFQLMMENIHKQLQYAPSY
jgi:ribonucleotide reductase beta subunit family protein with ferritin-like domain